MSLITHTHTQSLKCFAIFCKGTHIFHITSLYTFYSTIPAIDKHIRIETLLPQTYSEQASKYSLSPALPTFIFFLFLHCCCCEWGGMFTFVDTSRFVHFVINIQCQQELFVIFFYLSYFF